MQTPRDLSLRPVYPENRPPIPMEALSAEMPAEQPAEGPAEKYASLPIESVINIEIANMINTRKQASEDFRRDKREIWDKCWENYKQVYDSTGKEAWQSKVFQPDTAKVVEVITANLHAALLGPDIPVEWQVKVKEYEQAIRDTNDIVKNDIHEGKFRSVMMTYLRSLCLLGTAVGKEEYEKVEDIVMVKERPKVTLAERAIAAFLRRPLPVKEETYRPEHFTIKDFSKTKVCDLYKIFPEPYTTEINKDNWVIEESRITNRELVDLMNHEDPFYRIEGVTTDLLMNSTIQPIEHDPDTQARRFALAQGNVAMHYMDPDLPHQLLEYWGPVPIWMIESSKKDDPDSKFTMVNGRLWLIDGKWVVYRRLNPYRDGAPPYFKDTYIEVPGDWWGIGPAELMLGLQDEKNEAVNTGIDQINLSLQKIIAINKDKVVKGTWKRLVSKPGAVWLFEGVEDIRRAFDVVNFPDLTRDYYLRIEMLDRAIQETTGAVKATIGVGGAEEEAGGGTFRGQLLNKQAGSERFMLTAKGIELNGMIDCFKKKYHRIYQYKSYESAEKILGKERGATFEFIPPEQLDGIADLVPVGVSTMESKGTRLMQMSAFAKMWMNEPWLKKWDLARRMWIEMGYSDPDIPTFSEEEMKQFYGLQRSFIGQGPMGEGEGASGEGTRAPVASPGGPSGPTDIEAGPMGPTIPAGAPGGGA